MFSIYSVRKKEYEAKKNHHSTSLDRAIHSVPHARRTNALHAQYHLRVSGWIAATLLAEGDRTSKYDYNEGGEDNGDGMIPPIHSVSSAAQSARFYRDERVQRPLTMSAGSRDRAESERRASTAPSLSHRSGGGGTRRGAFGHAYHAYADASVTFNGPHAYSSSAPASSSSSPSALQHEPNFQMSPSRWQSESTRLHLYANSSERALLTNQGVYAPSSVNSASYRTRHKGLEIAGPFTYKARSTNERVQDSITARDVMPSGGNDEKTSTSRTKYGPPMTGRPYFPVFREETKDRWIGPGASDAAVPFTSRLPFPPLFSTPRPNAEVYAAALTSAELFRSQGGLLAPGQAKFRTEMPGDEGEHTYVSAAAAADGEGEREGDGETRLAHTRSDNDPAIVGGQAALALKASNWSPSSSSSRSDRLALHIDDIGGLRSTTHHHNRNQHDNIRNNNSSVPSPHHVKKTYWKAMTEVAHTVNAADSTGATSSTNTTARNRVGSSVRNTVNEYGDTDDDTSRSEAQELFKSYSKSQRM